MKTLAFAVAAVLATSTLAGGAHAQTDIETRCRLAAAAVWSNTLDAWENDMRELTYRKCIAGRTGVPSAAPPTSPPTPVTTVDEMCATTSRAYYGHPESSNPQAWAMCATGRTRRAMARLLEISDRIMAAGITPESVPSYGESIVALCGVTQIPLSRSIENCLVHRARNRAVELERFLAHRVQ